MFCIFAGDECVYACTDYARFQREAVKYASVRNAHFAMSDGTILGVK